MYHARFPSVCLCAWLEVHYVLAVLLAPATCVLVIRTKRLSFFVCVFSRSVAFGTA